MTDTGTTDALATRLHGGLTFGAFDAAHRRDRAAARELRERLLNVGFGPDSAPALFGVRDFSEALPRRFEHYGALILPDDDAGRAARFFVLNEIESERDLRAWLGDVSFRFLAEMTAIVPVSSGWRSLVSLTWFARALIASDPLVRNRGWPDEPAPDYVMPPGLDSAGLVRVAPRTRARRVLDLCCGSGAQAIAAAVYSEDVVAVDLNPRALHFARFNAAANGLDRVEFLLGDTYEPVSGRHFDAILANPPFVPWPEDAPPLLYRSGGPRGDRVLSRIVSGSAEHLEPSGTLSIAADLADVDALPARLRQWQGTERLTLALLQRRHSLPEYAEMHAAHLATEAERKAMTRRLLQHYDTESIRAIDFGYLVQRAEPGALHVMYSSAPLVQSVNRDVVAWLEHQSRLAGDESDDATLELAPGLRIVCERVLSAGVAPQEGYYLLPGSGSMLAPLHLTAAAFALLEKMADGPVRRRELAGAEESPELTRLLDGGWVRVSSTTRR